MILFSDAVFAIVITLMAIEIHLPETEKRPTEAEFLHNLRHVLPTIFAYTVSFFFIGMIWYRHLKVFSYLKTFDAGLVARNLFLLFCVGLFPFGASVISRPYNYNTPILIYLSIIILCLIAQVILQHYIFIQRPALRNHKNTGPAVIQLKLMKLTVSLFVGALILYAFTYSFVPPEYKQLAILWILPIIAIIRLTRNKYKKQGELVDID